MDTSIVLMASARGPFICNALHVDDVVLHDFNGKHDTRRKIESDE